jgi:hypothetical protein
MAAGTGYAIDLGGSFNAVKVLARCECFVQTAARQTAPPAPSSSPAPAPGDTATWLHMLVNEQAEIGIDAFSADHAPRGDRMTHLLVWCVTPGRITVNAH